MLTKNIKDYITFCNTNKNVNKNDYYEMINKIYDSYSDLTRNPIDLINNIQESIGYTKIPDINIRIYNARVKILKLLDKNKINFYNFNFDINPNYLFTLAIEEYLYNKYLLATNYLGQYLDTNIQLEKKYRKRINKLKFKFGKLSILNDLKNNQDIINNYKNICDSLDNITDKSEILNIAINYLNTISNITKDKDKIFVISTFTNTYARVLHTLNCENEIKKLLVESYKLSNKKVLKK